MSRGWQFNSGDWNAVCDSCGQKLKASQLRRRWDGMMVCDADFEIRHPMDFIKVRQDKISVPWSRPQVDPVFAGATAYEYETLPLSEVIETVADFYRNIGGITPIANDPDTVNGSVLNFGVLNKNTASTPPAATEELLTLSENIALTRTSFIEITGSDTLTLSESISFDEGEYPADSIGLSETVAAVIISNHVLNGHSVNGVTLG